MKSEVCVPSSLVTFMRSAALCSTLGSALTTDGLSMAAGNNVDIETLGTRVVYENRWMLVREDAVRRRDSSEGIYGVVEKPAFVVIVPLEEDGGIHLVQQNRYPVGARYWKFPQGSWEQMPGADPAQVARGELREET